MLSVPEGCSKRVKRSNLGSMPDKSTHRFHKSQNHSHVTNAGIGTKLCPDVGRYIKCSKDRSVSWKTPQHYGIESSVVCIQKVGDSSQVSLSADAQALQPLD